jgi:hypothetical protein
MSFLTGSGAIDSKLSKTEDKATSADVDNSVQGKWVSADVLKSREANYLGGGVENIGDIQKYAGTDEQDAYLLGSIEETGDKQTYLFKNPVALMQGINVKQLGAKGDNVTDDTPAFTEAVAALNARGGGMLVVPKGVYVCEDIALYFLTPIIMVGEGVGSGYGVPEKYLHNTSIIAKGTGEAFIRTRVRHRASSSDPQDPALSAVITYGSEGCDVRDIAIFCDADYTDFANNYARANYSMGIFNQGYPQCRATNVDIYGPFSLCSAGINATRATNMVEPLIPSLNVRFPKPTAHKVGVDGFTTYNLHAYGARWGAMLLGPQPSDPNAINLSGGTYYDQEAGAVLPDFRNGIGASDWDNYSPSFYGGDQHNGYRWSDITDPEEGETEEERYARMKADADPFTGSGCLYISGIEMSKMRFYNPRFSGSGPFRVYMEYVNDIDMYSPHGDFRGFKTDAAANYVTRIDVKATNGTDLKTLYPNGSGGVNGADATYGSIATYQCDSNNIIGGTLNPDSRYFEYDTDTCMISNTSGVTRFGALSVRDKLTESTISSTRNIGIDSDLEVDIRSGTLTRFRKGSSTTATLSDSIFQCNDISIDLRESASTISRWSVQGGDTRFTSTGAMDTRVGASSIHRWRHGITTGMTLSPTRFEVLDKTIALKASGATIAELYANAGNTIFASTGEMDIRAGAGSLIRFRHGSTTLATISPTSMTLNVPLNVAGLGISVKAYGAVGDGVTDDTTAFINAITAAEAQKKSVIIPQGEYLISKTLYTKANIIGDGTEDVWDQEGNGSILKGITPTEAAKRWTDIDGNTSGKDSPKFALLVPANSDVTIQGITLKCDPSTWHYGLFNPCLKRLRIIDVDTRSNFMIAGMYWAASWSNQNTTLGALHPRIDSDTGMNECSIRDSFIGGLWGFMIEGTDRDPEDYTNSTWIWSSGGCSDTVLDNCRIGSFFGIDASIREEDGGAIYIDAPIRGGANRAIQGIHFINCTLRTEAKYAAYIDRANRINFNNLYTETNSSFASSTGVTSRLTISDRTGHINKAADDFNANIFKLNTTTGVETQISSLGSNTPYRITENMNENFTPVGGITTQKNNGRLFSPNFTGSTNKSQNAEIITFQQDGNTRFLSKNYTDGSYDIDLVLSKTTLRPGKTGMSLGTASFPWANARTEALRVVTGADAGKVLVANNSAGDLVYKDYHQSGSFTPVLNAVTATYTTQTGTWRRLGPDLIYCEVYLDVATLDTADTSPFSIGGFPFEGVPSSGVVTINTFIGNSAVRLFTPTDPFIGVFNFGNALQLISPNGTRLQYNNAAMNAAGEFFASLTYRIDEAL